MSALFIAHIAHRHINQRGKWEWKPSTDCPSAWLWPTYMDAVSNSIWISPACDAVSIRHRIWLVCHCRRAGNTHGDCSARPISIWNWNEKSVANKDRVKGRVSQVFDWEYQQVAGCQYLIDIAAESLHNLTTTGAIATGVRQVKAF